MKQAKFVKEITVIDPDSNLPVEISIYKHENGGMFGIDSSYIEQVLFDDDDLDNMLILDPFVEPNSTNISQMVELND